MGVVWTLSVHNEMLYFFTVVIAFGAMVSPSSHLAHPHLSSRHPSSAESADSFALRFFRAGSASSPSVLPPLSLPPPGGVFVAAIAPSASKDPEWGARPRVAKPGRTLPASNDVELAEDNEFSFSLLNGGGKFIYVL